MFGPHFYHNSIRRYLTTFGNMFNDIRVARYTSNNSIILQMLEVPIQYGSKQKYIQMGADPPTTATTSIKLPRISFVLNGIRPDFDRKINPVHQNVRKTVQAPNSVKSQFVNLPYQLNIQLSILSKNYNDILQVVEQIIPYFHPSFSQKVILIPEMNNLAFDIKTELINSVFSDDFGGDVMESRILTWDMNFIMNVWFFGPVSSTGIIKRVQTDLIPVPGSGKMEDTPNWQNYGRQERIVIKPGLTANNTPTNYANNSINYNLIEADDPYGIIEELYSFQDGYKYNPVTGQDGPSPLS